MTKTLSIRNYTLELNLIKKNDLLEDWKKEKKIKAIEAELRYLAIEKEKQERLAALYWNR